MMQKNKKRVVLWLPGLQGDGFLKVPFGARSLAESVKAGVSPRPRSGEEQKGWRTGLPERSRVTVSRHQPR